MKNTLLAKTLTACLPGNPAEIYARISDPDNLPSWHTSFCRSLRKENGSLVVETPRGPLGVRFIRGDHSLVLDIFIELKPGVELLSAIRLLPNGDGSEMIWTLVKPDGITDSVFHEQLRWAGSALHALRKARDIKPPEPISIPVPVAVAVAAAVAAASPTEPLQAPSIAEVSSMPLSGKKLFIGNLTYDWTDEQLRAHFAEAGAVTSAEVARFRGRGGRSRGFGFVEMGTEAEAQAAIQKFHGVLAGGREIIVRIAKSQESRPPKVMKAAPQAASREAPASEAVEPGNERDPRSSDRPRNERPRRPGARPRNSSTPRPAPTATSYPRRIPGRRPGTGGGYQEVDITNKSGYEIFPRRAPGEPAPPRTPESPPVRRSSGEASPYMDDTGDIENHGRRPPPRRRRS